MPLESQRVVLSVAMVLKLLKRMNPQLAKDKEKRL